jgi:hypothetical protein
MIHCGCKADASGLMANIGSSAADQIRRTTLSIDGGWTAQ